MQDKDLSTVQTFKRLWPIISPFKLGLVVSGIALVINALADAGLISLLKPLLDEGFGKADVSFTYNVIRCGPCYLPAWYQ